MALAIKRGRDEFIARTRAILESVKQADIDPQEWEEILAEAQAGYHFSRLDDREWAAVRKSIEDGGRADFDDSLVRRAVDDAAFSCGYFVEFMAYDGPSRSHLTSSNREHEDAMQSATDLISYIEGENGTSGFSSYLQILQVIIRERINSNERRLERLPRSRPNAKRPEALDRWGAFLIRVWRDVLQLPVTNGVALQRFIMACASPYGRYKSESQARQFLKSYLAGEVVDPGAPISEALRE